ncbi:MAG: LacI family DNA-binding transcriptional regulator [Segetibacter sp.]|nr:LacI family DNA-binding transcriptional regulator [Segetibacter sp.]
MEIVTLKKLAELLNVSQSSVSKALKDSHEIGQETKNRIKALAQELNYKPNASASSLRRKSSKTIGVVVPLITNSFYALAINGIETVAQAKDHHVLIYLTYETYKKEVDSIRHLQNGIVDGVLLSISRGTTDYEHLRELKSRNIPLVFFDRVCESMNGPWVTVNNHESGYAATEHLIKNGCKSVAYLSFANHLSTTGNRLKGYLEALKKCDLHLDEELIIECTNNDEENYKKIKKLLQSKNCPHGIFASIERLALITYHVCKELKLKIPNDLKIISFSNLETASLLKPSLSTMTPNAFEIGRKAAEILFENIEKKNFKGKLERITIPASLIERESSQLLP